MTQNIDAIGREALAYLELKHAARERALPKARATIRACATSIRATHRQEVTRAQELLGQAADLLAQMSEDLRDHQDIYYAGFVQDAQKEFVEATTFAAMTQHRALPTPYQLAVSWASYLNGLAEAVGELRRYVLDQLRQGNIDACEVFLSYMDDIYSQLILIDLPDAITAGLRRTTDATRGILEKTRGDLTSAVAQAQVQQAMVSLREELQRKPSHDI